MFLLFLFHDKCPRELLIEQIFLLNSKSQMISLSFSFFAITLILQVL